MKATTFKPIVLRLMRKGTGPCHLVKGGGQAPSGKPAPRHSVAAGAGDFLGKPYTAKTLLLALRRVLRDPEV